MRPQSEWLRPGVFVAVKGRVIADDLDLGHPPDIGFNPSIIVGTPSHPHKIIGVPLDTHPWRSAEWIEAAEALIAATRGNGLWISPAQIEALEWLDLAGKVRRLNSATGLFEWVHDDAPSNTFPTEEGNK